MTPYQPYHIFVVDDEPQVCKAVRQILSKKYQVSCFNKPEDCLARLKKTHVDCHLVISDVKMPGMSGLELLEAIKPIRPSLTVLLITGYGDIPMAVQAMRAGAHDFIEKPLHRESLLLATESALKEHAVSGVTIVRALTMAEKKVLKLMLKGQTSKQIAEKLGISVRTVDEHRHNIKLKLGANTLFDIYRIGSKIDLSDVACG